MIDTSFLKGKTAIVTGASGGIGEYICVRLAELGINVAGTARNIEKLNGVADKVTVAGSEFYPVSGDITDLTFQDRLLEDVKNHFGHVDFIINCAGIAQHDCFADVTPELYDRVFLLNVRAPYFLCQKSIPYLMASDCGTIINVASVVGHDGYPEQSVYAASKHALIGFSKSLANEYYDKGIRVHVISPGAVLTDMVKLARPDLAAHPEGMTSPDEVADAVSYFLIMRQTNSVIDEIRLHRKTKAPAF